ncbi:MAG TPA: hypothetical protein VF899_13475 [Pyrinomonadaceae bacterium]
MKTFVDDCRNSFVTQPNWANASTVKYPLKLRKPHPFKIRFHLFVMRRINFSNVKQPLTFVCDCAMTFCGKDPARRNVTKSIAPGG